MIIPVTGATTIKIAVAPTTPPRTASQPNAATNAPANPPISVCDDEEGIPYHQVIKFQAIAESSPAKIIGSGLAEGCVNSSCTTLAMVFATLWSLKMKNATKLKNAAQTTAWNGLKRR